MTDKRSFINETAEGEYFDPKMYASPSKLYSPIFSWSLNSELSKDEVRRQLENMKRDGIRSVYPLPLTKRFRPTGMYSTLSPECFGEEYQSLMRYAAEVCEELDMAFILYDEDGWPSGSASGDVGRKFPEHLSREFSFEEVNLEKGKEYDFSAALSVRSDGNRLPKVFTSEEDGKAEIIKIVPRQKLASPYPDTLSKKAMDFFAERAYEGFKKGAEGTPPEAFLGVFTDEPGIAPYHYTDELFSRFKEKYGYDLEENLHHLFGDSDDGAKVRTDYRDLLADMFAENYFGTLQAWCEKNGVAFTGHADGDNNVRRHDRNSSLLRVLRRFDVPGVDAIVRQIYPCEKKMTDVSGGKGSPNLVPEGENGFFPRVASSAASQSGKKFSMTESFAVYGGSLTPSHMRYILGFQAVRGINVFNPMSVYSGYEAEHALALRPNISEGAPERDFWHLTEKYFSRISYLMSLGKRACDIALYYPIRDIWSETNKESAAAAYEAMGAALEARNIDFDLIDEDIILACDGKDGEVKSGYAEYKALCVPECKYMSGEAKKRIAELEKAGFKVYTDVNDVPENTSALKVNGNKIRSAKRTLSDGSEIYFIFNEALEASSARFTFDGNSAILIDPSKDDFMRISSGYEAELSTGECAVVILGSTDIPAKEFVPFERIPIASVHDFKVSADKEYSVAPTLTRMPSERKPVIIDSRKTSNPFGALYSGSLIYEADFDIPRVDFDTYDIAFETNYAASVYINGELAGETIGNPAKATFSGGLLKEGKNTVKLLISTTQAGAYLSEYDYADDDTKGRFATWYHRMELTFERESLGFSTLKGDLEITGRKEIL